MIRLIFSSIILLFLLSCTNNKNPTTNSITPEKEATRKIYSRSVNDSFFISVSLPPGYDSTQKNKYPIAYILDANLYFDVYSTLIRKYSEVNLLPEIVLVGIGYKDFSTMDSLRNRDYTYPDALSKYEMPVSGKGKQFLSFIRSELIPRFEHEYNVDTSKRILAGHSLGGFFCLYAFEQAMEANSNIFNTYISASPSIDYDDYYILNKLKEIPGQAKFPKQVRLYIGFGDNEDEDEKPPISYIEAMGNFSSVLKQQKFSSVIYKNAVFSNLDHMDTQIPTFIKGLQWSFMQ